MLGHCYMLWTGQKMIIWITLVEWVMFSESVGIIEMMSFNPEASVYNKCWGSMDTEDVVKYYDDWAPTYDYISKIT